MKYARSPLAPAAFPPMPALAGLDLRVGKAGFYAYERDDLLLMRFGEEASASLLTTQNACPGAPIVWSRASHARSGGRPSAMLANAGNSNVALGEAGLRTAEAWARAAGGERALMFSTGVIGKPFPLFSPEDALAAMRPASWEEAARAIMTTDTFPKGAAAEAALPSGGLARVCGVAKGSGMIAPNMATMLAFIVLDAALSPDRLDRIWRPIVARTFNRVTVDGDASTSDAALCVATGAGEPIECAESERTLAEALERVAADLSEQIARDGEGATKLIRVEVRGAASDADAERAARAIAESPLVKTAIAGEDANWGRVIMAVGKSGAAAELARLSVRFAGFEVCRNGMQCVSDEDALDRAMAEPEIAIEVDLGLGDGQARMLACDLTHGYISINADYRS